MPGVTPLRPDDGRSARAWAAFVADDAASSAPASLEARVMRAAQAALAQQREDAERRRRQWFAGLTAIAASLLVAAAWSLTPGGLAPSGVIAPADAPRAEATPASAAVPARAESSARTVDEPPGRPVPMTNIEAGRVLATPPEALLASRPLFDPADGARPVRAPGSLRSKSFGAPTIEPAFANGRPTHAIAAPMAVAAAPPVPLAPAATPVAATAPEAWSSRSFKGVFDPQASETPAPPPIRLDQAAPAPAKPPAPSADPPAPPK